MQRVYDLYESHSKHLMAFFKNLLIALAIHVSIMCIFFLPVPDKAIRNTTKYALYLR